MKNEKGSDFLKSLQKAVEIGDPKIASDTINKINKIYEMSEHLNYNKASTDIEKRLEDAGQREIFTKDEMESIDIYNEKERLRFEEENERNKMIADIANLEHNIKLTNFEYEESKENFEKEIKIMEIELNNLKFKYQSKYDETEL